MAFHKISIADINILSNIIERNNFDCNCLHEILPGQIEIQKINHDNSKIIIKNISEDISVAVVDCTNNKIKNILFNGVIDINPQELVLVFGTFREGYSIYDDLYFYFFNEDRKNGNYVISFFDPFHNSINIQDSEESLSNIALSWQE